MTEQDLYKAIKKSAQDVEVPEQLTPKEMLKRVDQEGRPEKVLGRYWKRLGAVAAVLVLIVGITAVARFGLLGTDSSGEMADLEGSDAEMDEASEGVSGVEESTDLVRKPKQDAGDMFAVAKDYDQVYALLEEMQTVSKTYGVMMDGLQGEAVADGGGDTFPAASGAMREDAAEAIMNTGNQQGYSKTNVQTEGVDESDIIKTDGSYIYAVHQDGIVITDISGETMTEASRIRLEDAGARVMEMYVQGNVLNLIVQQADSELKQEEEYKSRELEDVFYMNTASTTHLLTYDISDREHPVLAGDVSQDGSYYTSRKIGSIVYLFTTEYDMSDIPSIGGCRVAYDCIYLPERGRQGLLVSSIDVKKPKVVQDHVMVVNDYVDIYVSTGAMYLYQYSWQDQNLVTQIAKFSLDKGNINAVGSVSVRGEILDTFAINEGNGQLRVLTTDWGSDEEVNNLFVLDDSLKLMGSLQGLAPGEQIYAARFLGNTAYFVTYRNTDPLFAVDLTNPADPKVLSELKITGFSEYLHFWGADKLLGIGYETDPDTGRFQGIKLTMFDVSNPAEPGVLDSVVLKGLDYSPAIYEYKSVLADSNANLFGFVGVDYQDSGAENHYYLYQWGEGGFKRLLKAELDSGAGQDQYRGLYSGAGFYLAGPDGITSYDRGNEYDKIESLLY